MFEGIKGVNMMMLEHAQLGIQWVCAGSMRLVWMTSIAIGVIACVCSVLLPNMSKYLT